MSCLTNSLDGKGRKPGKTLAPALKGRVVQPESIEDLAN